MVTSPLIGVLALQGDVREHVRALEAIGARTMLVRTRAHIDEVDGLILPGGESSVIDKLARAFGLQDPIRRAIADGLPVYGTCAGMILLADRIVDGIVGQQSFGGVDMAVRRNAFGGQTESFETTLEAPAIGGAPVTAVFIRAPVVEESGPLVETVAHLPDGRAVAVRQGNLLATAFHPEVTEEHRFHEMFLAIVRSHVDGGDGTGARAPL
ncbi:pyridoxal 5'-phosphate synthase glutaminase subunit PdxT [Microbacterium koreense]|uniref:Pyridoxal 5'-phosphate synthase subunit PdxT n=1 Tax=Microbacterium koreense TaxID=323761 RepID=A0ABW2ZSB5_9MICO